MKNYKRILSIAGSDSGAGAGIQADVKTIMANGGYATTVITAITAQNTLGVESVFPIPTTEVQHQLHAVTTDIGYDAVKTGMLPSAEVGKLISAHLSEYPTKNVVVDPVLTSTSGSKLAQPEMVEVYKTHLLPLTTVFTPNLAEAAIFLNCKPITSLSEQQKACKQLASYGSEAVLLKGGHGEGHKLIDVLYIQEEDAFTVFMHPKIETSNLHGTGCTLSSAIATFLAHNYSIKNACEKAIAYTQVAINAGQDYKLGKGTGPLKH